MYAERREFYRRIETARKSKVIAYITGDRPGMETQIHPEVLDYFTDHLDSFGRTNKITLVLYSRGGITLAGWGIVNLIRQFSKHFEVIIPAKAQSTATLIALGAETIMMTKQATLGPIDPSVNSPLNPAVPGAPPTSRLPISVEEVVGYLELAKQQAGLKTPSSIAPAFLKLGDHVHPIALGRVYRARTQIKMLATRLLSRHMRNQKDIQKVVEFICSESGSHDYTIFRKEACDELKLPIEKPTQEFYDNVIKPYYLDIRSELQLNDRYEPMLYLGNDTTKDYLFPRILVESITGGQHVFVSQGNLIKKLSPGPVPIVTGFEDVRLFEGWKYNAAPTT